MSEDIIGTLQQQLAELQSLATALSADTCAARSRALIRLLAELADSQPPAVPDQRQP